MRDSRLGLQSQLPQSYLLPIPPCLQKSIHDILQSEMKMNEKKKLQLLIFKTLRLIAYHKGNKMICRI